MDEIPTIYAKTPEDWEKWEANRKAVGAPLLPYDPNRCHRCGHNLRLGDWPFCEGKPEHHLDPHYGFTWGKGGPFTKG